MDQQMISFDQSGYPRLKLIRRRREQSEEGKKLLQEVLRKARLRDLPPLPDINLHRSGSCRRSPALALARAKLTCYIADKSRKPRPRPQEYSTRLLHRPAELVLPPPMQSSWEQEILQLVPPRLAKKYAAKVDSLLQQVRADYEATLHDFGVRMMQLASGKVQLAVFPAAQRPWGRGRTDRYNVYLRHRSYFKKRLFLTHPILRVILDKSYLLIPQQLNDYRQYRDLGLVDLLKLRNAISADLKKSEALITNHWYPKICKMLPSKKGLSSVPSQLWVSFLNCASHVMASMITAAMTRTIGKVLEVMSDHHTVPLLKIDLLLEDTGIELFPSKSEIYQCFHNVLNTIAGLAQNLPALETWVSVVSDKALLKVELCPHYLEKAHRALDASLDLLFQPVFDYVASLSESRSPARTGCERAGPTLVMLVRRTDSSFQLHVKCLCVCI
ncbi:dynein axonemal heavy chain 12-like [Bacillus rossius redtenbacheri]|uniref:dynein axonemal heavy chain 12-like n=1 Tax=Bacillus rossius redtenbacheri TaxID=93214 RepID=UPI002FDCDFF2